jgi:prepilin-type processing-associated H-X9-DG protein
VNHGSGELNPADGSYLHEFRMKEGVDISYTKFYNTPDAIDDSPWTVVMPPANQFYVGWTEPGEWFNITVDVELAGDYMADLLYTSNRGGTISIDVNGKPASGEITIPTTFNEADPVAWRQWHHWNMAPRLVRLQLPVGRSLLTIHIVSGGQMNLAWLDFHVAH